MSGPVAAGLMEVRARLTRACDRAGRTQSSVTLVAVSKGQSVAAIREAYEAGQRDFGESYAQELRDKAPQLQDLSGLRWHFLGPVQTNKLKYLVPAVALLHSVDRLELAQALSTKLTQAGRTLEVLLEVNVAREASKHGLQVHDVDGMVSAVRALPALKLCGLMCIPPQQEHAEGNRAHFQTLAQMARQHGLPQLSMGMSGDFEVAIAEGATLVRVGTAIFGPRDS